MVLTAPQFCGHRKNQAIAAAPQVSQIRFWPGSSSKNESPEESTGLVIFSAGRFSQWRSRALAESKRCRRPSFLVRPPAICESIRLSLRIEFSRPARLISETITDQSLVTQRLRTACSTGACPSPSAPCERRTCWCRPLRSHSATLRRALSATPSSEPSEWLRSATGTPRDSGFRLHQQTDRSRFGVA